MITKDPGHIGRWVNADMGEVFRYPPRVDHGDDRAALRVEHKAGLGASLGGFHRHGVGDPFGGVAVGASARRDRI
jgi:hypothetical protein